MWEALGGVSASVSAAKLQGPEQTALLPPVSWDLDTKAAALKGAWGACGSYRRHLSARVCHLNSRLAPSTTASTSPWPLLPRARHCSRLLSTLPVHTRAVGWARYHTADIQGSVRARFSGGSLSLPVGERCRRRPQPLVSPQGSGSSPSPAGRGLKAGQGQRHRHTLPVTPGSLSPRIC